MLLPLPWVLSVSSPATAGPHLPALDGPLGPDPATIALQALPAGPLSHEVVGTVPLGGRGGADRYGPHGVAVQLAPVLDGLPVDVVRVVQLDPGGRVVSITGDVALSAAPASGAPISRAAASAIAEDLVGGDEIGARLSWQPVRGVLRRVWTVERTGPPSPRAPHRVPQVRVDAETGQVLSLTDAAEHAPPPAPLARVYRHNPVVDPEPSEVELPLAALALTDDRIVTRQCRDLGDTREDLGDDGQVYELHVCTPVDAAGPVDGHYLYEPDPWPADPGRDEDDFAAPNVYWNVHQGLAWFDALGWTPVERFDPRVDVLVNYRVTDLWSEQTATDPTGALAPYRNAYFTGGYETSEDEWIPPQLVFGQGPDTDFAYDADVVHHELGHLVVRSVGGPRFSADGPYGPSVRARALNEGFADYFSSAIHGDPLLSEYVAGDGEPIRDLEGGETCGRDLWGEPHYDSLPFSGALWAFRRGLGPDDQLVLDGAVLDSLALMGTSPDFPDAAAVIEGLVTARLGEAAADALAAEFEARGVHECLPVVDVAAGDEPFRRGAIVGGAYWFSVTDEIPAPIQYRVEIPEGGAVFRLSFDQSEFLGFDPFVAPPQPLGAVGRAGAEPIRWEAAEEEVPVTTTGGGTFDLVVTDWIPDATEHGEALLVTTEPDPEDEQSQRHRYEIAWTVEEAGPYVFQLTNAHPVEAIALDLTVTLEPIELTPPTEPGGAPSDEVEPKEEPGGCGCGAPQAPPVAFAALAALALVRRRR